MKRNAYSLILMDDVVAAVDVYKRQLYKFAVAFLANIDKSTGRNRSVRCFCGMFFLNMFLLAAVTVHDQTRIETVQA